MQDVSLAEADSILEEGLEVVAFSLQPEVLGYLLLGQGSHGLGPVLRPAGLLQGSGIDVKGVDVGGEPREAVLILLGVDVQGEGFLP